MGKKKKQFIDKKNAHSFQLVHRSQKDPLQADEESSKHVLLPIDFGIQDASEINSILGKKQEEKKEEREHGIFFDDDYDYLQHIKPRTNLCLEPLPDNVTVIETKKPLAAGHVEFGSVKLPGEAFSSAFEQTEGLLNLAAPVSGPRPDLDPDIVAALDDALDLDDPNNILDDDFILQANKGGDGKSDDDIVGRVDDHEGDIFPSDDSENEFESDDDEYYFEEEETKSRFTDYSMTSSVIRRNEGLKLIDERFEKLMEEYDEDEIGALDHVELEGTINPDSDRLASLVEEFIDSQKKQILSNVQQNEVNVGHDEDIDTIPDELVRIAEGSQDKWDCESILMFIYNALKETFVRMTRNKSRGTQDTLTGTYSNLYNHPTVIKELPKVKAIKLSKEGFPVGVLSKKGAGSESIHMMDSEEYRKDPSRTTFRNRLETKEEKKQRKHDVKADRKARRVEKKANKMAFKSEKQRQEKSLLNSKQQRGKKL